VKAVELTRLRAALDTMLSPLACANREEWCILVGRRLNELFQADATMVITPVGGAPLAFSDQYPEMSSWFDQNTSIDGGNIVSTNKDFDVGLQARRRFAMSAWTFSMVDRMTGHRLSRSEYYNDIVVASTGIRSSVGVFTRTPEGESAVTIGGFARDWEPFGSSTIGMLELILPAFCAGLEITNAVGNAGKALAVTIDALAEGVLLWDRHLGRPVHRNRALGEMIAADPEGAMLDAEIERLARGLNGAPGASRLQAGSIVLKEIVTTAARYRLRASLLPPSLVNRDGALLVAVERTTPPVPTPTQLVSAFGFTQREASIALRLGTGASDRAIAEALGLSPHTVRHHVERIFLKLDVHSRKAIAQHLLGATVTSGRVY
jgi:DNA-binding CsgD family transcriptional regulator